METGWIFPYEEIKKDCNIIIYGAGKMGKCLYKQIVNSNYCKIAAWVDISYNTYRADGLDVISPEKITSIEFDYIMISIDSPKTCYAVFHYLVDMGISMDKIWSPYRKTKKEIEVIEKEKNEEMYNDFLNTTPDLKCLKIAFIIPNPIKGGGGHRNIFRAVKYLKDSGHEIDVYYISSDDEETVVKQNVCNWFYEMSNVNFIKYRGEMKYYDVGIATWWETAYILKKYEYKTRRQFYFVQDFEPYFYPLSSKYIFAENTYKFGFSHICSGPWCETMLRKKYNAKAVSFQFPLDTNIYNDSYSRNKKEKNIVFFAKPEMPRRCFEIGIEALEIFKRNRPDVEIIMFGSKTLNKSMVPFDATILNIVPTLEDLAQMYADADLGIAFSITNPSLVPYEMISCGCPVADLNVEYALSKYGNDDNNVFLFDSLPEKFAQGLIGIIDDDKLLKEKSENARKWVLKEFPSELEMGKFVEKNILSEF